MTIDDRENKVKLLLPAEQANGMLKAPVRIIESLVNRKEQE